MTSTMCHRLPEPAGIADRVQFGHALTALRERAGFTIRDIARAVDIPVATAGDYFAGRTLPPLKSASVLPHVLRTCGVIDPDRIEEWRVALIRVRRTVAAPAVPFRGLAPFQPADAGWLFGRDDVVRTLTDRLAQRVPIVLTGPAGAGKSSVLRAGLLPTLAGRGWLMTPGRSPCRRLADRLCAALGAPADHVDRVLHRDPGGIGSLVRGARPVLVIDQFEELRRDEPAGRTFTAALAALARAGVGVVVGSRDAGDLAARLHSPAVSIVPVDPLDEARLREIIGHLARRARVTLEPGLDEMLVADAGRVRTALPSLSHALLMTWRNRTSATLTVRAYRAAGGVEAAVHRSVDRVCATLTAPQHELAKDLLGALRTRCLVEPTRIERRPGELAAVLDAFATEGLLTKEDDLVKVTQEVVLLALSERLDRRWKSSGR